MVARYRSKRRYVSLALPPVVCVETIPVTLVILLWIHRQEQESESGTVQSASLLHGPDLTTETAQGLNHGI